MRHGSSILVTCWRAPLARSLSRVRSVNRESCGALRRAEAELGCSRSDTVGFVTLGPLQSSKGGRGGSAEGQPTASCIVAWMRGFAAMSAPKCAGAAMSRAFLYHAVLRKTREEPLERSLSHLVKNFCGSLFLQDRVAVHSQNVIDATDAKTFTKESEFCLRVMALLDTLVRGSNDVRLCQELVRDELSRSNSDSRGMFCTSPSSPFRRCCTQVVHVVDDFRF